MHRRSEAPRKRILRDVIDTPRTAAGVARRAMPPREARSDGIQRPSDFFTAAETGFFCEGAAAFIFGTAFLGFFVSRLLRCFSEAMRSILGFKTGDVTERSRRRWPTV